MVAMRVKWVYVWNALKSLSLTLSRYLEIVNCYHYCYLVFIFAFSLYMFIWAQVYVCACGGYIYTYVNLCLGVQGQAQVSYEESPTLLLDTVSHQPVSHWLGRADWAASPS